MLEMKENEQAMECFKNCISIEPNHISSLLNISHILIHKKTMRDALIYLNSLLKYDPKNTNALNNFGVCSLKMRSLDDASNSFLLARSLDSKNVEVLINLNLVSMEKKITNQLKSISKRQFL